MHDEMMMEDDKIRADEMLDARVVAALELQPEVSVPADFAARVAGKVAVRRTSSLRVEAMDGIRWRRTHYGYAMGVVSMVVLLVAMLAFAPRAVGSSTIWVGMEWLLCGQFLLLAIWFVLRGDRLR